MNTKKNTTRMKGNPRKWWFHNVSFHTCYNPHILFARLTRRDFSKFGHTATYPIWPWLVIVLIRFAGSGDDLMHLRSSHCELYPLQDDMIWAWRSMARWWIWCEITMMSCMSPWKTVQLIHKTFAERIAIWLPGALLLVTVLYRAAAFTRPWAFG